MIRVPKRRVLTVACVAASLVMSGCCFDFCDWDNDCGPCHGGYRHRGGHGRCDSGDLNGDLAVLAILGGVVLVAAIGQELFGHHQYRGRAYSAAGLPGRGTDNAYLYHAPPAYPTAEPEPPQLCTAR